MPIVSGLLSSLSLHHFSVSQLLSPRMRLVSSVTPFATFSRTAGWSGGEGGDAERDRVSSRKLGGPGACSLGKFVKFEALKWLEMH